MEVQLSEKSLHAKVVQYVYGQSNVAERFQNLCPYFWTAVSAFLLLPFMFVVKTIWAVVKGFEYRVEVTIEHYRFEYLKRKFESLKQKALLVPHKDCLEFAELMLEVIDFCDVFEDLLRHSPKLVSHDERYRLEQDFLDWVRETFGNSAAGGGVCWVACNLGGRHKARLLKQFYKQQNQGATKKLILSNIQEVLWALVALTLLVTYPIFSVIPVLVLCYRSDLIRGFAQAKFEKVCPKITWSDDA